MGNASKPIALALQGGGSHSAFAWGAVDRLLTEEAVHIEAISAVSGGAMMAAVLAQGMMEGGRETARKQLETFWRKVSLAMSLFPLRMNLADKFLGHAGIDLSPSSMALDYITRIFSPYQFNLFDINPLRGIVEEMVDFEALQKSPVALYIGATHARTGKAEIFSREQLSLDAVMASSCLPFVFKTVEIDGEPYWDGSFSGCPPLFPLAESKGTPDIVLVQVNSAYVEEVPTSAADILDRANEISFHSVLLHELKTIALQNKTAARPVHVHRIEAQDMLASLGRASKLNADWNFLTYLRDLGAQAAEDWLKASRDKLGRESSLDISALAA
ncbi:MAG: patatin-like phospholipase family protein [Pseudomonadota bacterium]|nr:patatin-like phospholipase family protein [Pseudomonadota bacterium]